MSSGDASFLTDTDLVQWEDEIREFFSEIQKQLHEAGAMLSQLPAAKTTARPNSSGSEQPAREVSGKAESLGSRTGGSDSADRLAVLAKQLEERLQRTQSRQESNEAK